ncbi:uncharacterized protein N7498_006561 [Penicillium cinerascens]|uniref:FAD dependent oxidoreductase domain-containing protein n=1 Tax=Penicillium cinerascens TaxID=70096 RepID=A0A9W9MIH3_9EURO|nr:uncharacterized protein N7498_006561 [Penicillium cinerascens]KAJ5201898.1 hypothetical protein N7498_006561 [Penicillium cinerascens]
MPSNNRPLLPVQNSMTSYWMKDPHRLASYRTSSTVPEQCDIAVIGTGMSGVATAYHILSDPHIGSEKPSVVLLEARQACSGATGRNGGHTKLSIPIIQRTAETHGPEAAVQMVRHHLDQLAALKEVVDKEGIDCDLRVTRSFDIFFDEKHAQKMEEFLSREEARGTPWTQEVQWIEKAQSDKITGVRNTKGALCVPAVSLWPYKLFTELLSKVLELGGQLYTETCVTEVKEDAGQATLTTSRGTLIAKKTIFATNAYTAALLPQYESIITPLKGQNSHLSPAPSFTPPNPLANTYNLHFDSHYADYLVPRPDGTIILGGAKWTYEHDRKIWWNNVDDTTLINDATTEHFDSVIADHFSGWENARAHHDMVWTGIMASTPDVLPHVGRVPGSKNQWVLAGFNGAGMTQIFTMTQAIARMVTRGAEYDDTGLPGMFKTTDARLAVRHQV